MHGLTKVNVIAIVDSGYAGLVNKIDGIPVVTPEAIFDVGQFDYKIITVLDDLILDEITLEAQSVGIERNRILSARIFDIPFLILMNMLR